MTLRRALGIILVGALGTLVASWSLRGSASSALLLIAKAGGAALAVGTLGTAALTLLRRRSFADQTTIVILTTVLAIAAGAVAAGRSMFVSPSPYSAMAVVLVSSGTVGLLTGLFLSHRMGQGSQRLAATARRIGIGGRAVSIPEPPTEELAKLAHELEAMSRRLEESRARATALDEARRELVAWISHDLRTPLARIRAVVEALEDGIMSDPAGVADYHRRLTAEADRLAHLVDGLFELSRINAQAVALEFGPVRLGDLVSDLVAAFLPIARKREITLQAELRGADPTVEASTEHLERALSNLLDNALRYSGDGAEVEVEVGSEEGTAYVAISDSCGGLTGEELSRMFDAGFAHERRRRSNSGTGLGLAVAKGLVEAQGGAIAVHNSGEGCRFVVTFSRASKGVGGENTSSASPLPVAAPRTA